MKDNLMLDMYLAPHINTLFSMIRNRGLIQYFSPYSSADLHRMANSFNTTVTDLENELMKLILDGSIQVVDMKMSGSLMIDDVFVRLVLTPTTRSSWHKTLTRGVKPSAERLRCQSCTSAGPRCLS